MKVYKQMSCLLVKSLIYEKEMDYVYQRIPGDEVVICFLFSPLLYPLQLPTTAKSSCAIFVLGLYPNLPTPHTPTDIPVTAFDL